MEPIILIKWTVAAVLAVIGAGLIVFVGLAFYMFLKGFFQSVRSRQEDERRKNDIDRG